MAEKAIANLRLYDDCCEAVANRTHSILAFIMEDIAPLLIQF